MDETHLTEEMLNMLLDGALGPEERARAEAHLATCPACEAELAALRGLFGALDELAAAPLPAPNLVPGVLARIYPRHRSWQGWLIPALQGAAAVALLAWGWGALTGAWDSAVAGLPLPVEALGRAGGRLASLWRAVQGWPEAATSGLRLISARLPAWGHRGISPLQMAAVVGSAGALWLVGNGLLLRHPLQEAT